MYYFLAAPMLSLVAVVSPWRVTIPGYEIRYEVTLSAAWRVQGAGAK